ncbi:hypothetical protein LCGC14_1291580 [marine sediment metagenome]|uniref:Glycosyltransferase 2-like domain-containing protein n=1 Tax=marine sediment metagenome TaxID=412755 RepID=A0A0F9NV65_9ZZZZ
MQPSVYIGSAVWRDVVALHVQSLIPLLLDNEHYIYKPQVGDALVERSRAMSASYFLRETDGEVHLSLDSDIVEFTKDAIDQMCEQTRKYDIVAAAYICRATARTFPASFLEEGTRVEFGFDSTPVPVKWAATGCMAVHRRVFEKMAETMPLLHESDGPRAFYPFYQSMIWDEPEINEKILLSEDFAFCQRARDLGFGVYINPSIRLGHMGAYVHRIEDMAQKMLKPQPMAITRMGRHYKVEYSGETESDADLGRLSMEMSKKKDEELFKPSRAERRRNKRKALTTI